MSDIDAKKFHRLFGTQSPRISYLRSDFLDYVLMILGCGAVVSLVYGASSWLAVAGYGLGALLLLSFPLRHGISLRVPLILRRPQDVLYMVIYKIRNIRPMFLAAAGILLLDQCFIALTPQLPHASELLRKIAIDFFYVHVVLLTIYRTAVLVSYLRNEGVARAVLMETSWKYVIARQPNMRLQIFHAYFTGLLAHLILIAPWYVVLTHCRYSIITLPIVVVLNFMVFRQYMRTYNFWFYRDHWLGHNSELEFLYLHGPHHDAIPCGLIGVSGNGFLEGLFRHSLGNPMAMYGPLAAFFLYTFEVLTDINSHQYIPGVFPTMPRKFHEHAQHSTHHYGRLEPYGVGLRVDQPGGLGENKLLKMLYPPEVRTSYLLDEQLTDFAWDNPRHRRFLELVDKYQKQA
jgi:hypothetical protein